MNDVNLVMTQVLGFGEKVVMESYHLQVKHLLPTLRQGEASLDPNSVLLEFFSQKKGPQVVMHKLGLFISLSQFLSAVFYFLTKKSLKFEMTLIGFLHEPKTAAGCRTISS